MTADATPTDKENKQSGVSIRGRSLIGFKCGIVALIVVALVAASKTPAKLATSHPCPKPPTARGWAALDRYDSANEAIMEGPESENRIVFFGDSITEAWNLDESFPGKVYINRGIGGQTIPQFLLRFHQDVVDLKPKLVVILAGTNDVAENTGPETLEDIEGNLASMAEIAESNHFRVVLSSILPVASYPWRKEIQSAEKIATLNNWMKGFAAGRGLAYLDYYSALVDEHYGMKAGLSEDGVHPNKARYAVMQPLAEYAIQDALRIGN
jgi:lysophospholipase L1-like esterase